MRMRPTNRWVGSPAVAEEILQSAYVRTLEKGGELEDGEGNVAEVTDFAPRFHQYDRIFRPPTLVRRIAPVKGLPRLRLRVRPRFAYGQEVPQQTLGSNHVRYASHSGAVRLTTDAPLA